MPDVPLITPVRASVPPLDTFKVSALELPPARMILFDAVWSVPLESFSSALLVILRFTAEPNVPMLTTSPPWIRRSLLPFFQEIV